MENENWKIKIVDLGYTTLQDVYIFRQTFDGKIEILTKDGIVIKEDGCIPEPTIKLLPEQLQVFADTLNDKGYKPRQGFLEGKIEATEKHLEDMRKLVFKIK